MTLSAQATDVGVNKATRKLFPVANTPQQIARLGVEKLKPYISTIGLYNTKAANVVAMAQQLIEHHGGEGRGQGDDDRAFEDCRDEGCSEENDRESEHQEEEISRMTHAPCAKSRKDRGRV